MTRWPQPDFLAVPSRRPLVAATLLAVSGLAALAVATHAALSIQADIDARTEASSLAITGRAQPRRPIASAEDAERAATSHRFARSLSDALAYPWDPILSSLEAVTPNGVQWIAFDHHAGDGGMRLEGQAGDAATAARTTAALAGATGWQDVQLIRLQRAQGRDNNMPDLRFAIEARIAPLAFAALGAASAP